MHVHSHACQHATPDGPGPSRGRLALRATFGLAVLAAAAAATCAVTVPAGEAMVITRLGDPVRVLGQPGLGWKLPAPIEAATAVDLRLRTTAGGLQDVGTRDGLRVLAQAYVAWQVPDDADSVRRFLRSLGNSPEEAAVQMRSLVAAALHVTASGFDLSDLVNTDPGRVRLGEFERRLRDELASRMRDAYGITVREVGIERLGLPAETLAAAVSRMRAERETVAAERTAEGLRQANAIRADAQRDARITVSDARAEAAAIEGRGQREAAAVHAAAFGADPSLYVLLRSLDTLGAMVGPGTRLVLRTDAAPFRALVEGPVTLPEGAPVAIPTPGGTTPPMASGSPAPGAASGTATVRNAPAGTPASTTPASATPAATMPAPPAPLTLARAVPPAPASRSGPTP